MKYLCNRKFNKNSAVSFPFNLTSKFVYLIYVFTILGFLFINQHVSAHEEQNTSGKIKSQSHNDIRIVMAAAFVSDEGVEVYNKIFTYLAKKLGRKVTFISGFSYETINTMLDGGMVDVGFICGLPYTLKHDIKPPSVELIAAPVMKDKKYLGKPVYFSYIITHKDNKASKFLDLRGRIFTYNDEISNSGYNMPRAFMVELGETKGFFGTIKRSGSHEESIRQIAMKEADVSAVDSLVYDYSLLNNNEFVSKTKILKVLGPAGIPPVVVSTKTPLATRNAVQDALINMHNDPEGRVILDHAFVDKFIHVDDSNYDGIRKMKNSAVKKGFEKIY